jgi:hypothetical protein
VSASLGGGIPLVLSTESTVDISPFLRFHWRQQVYYKVDDSDNPSESREKLGGMVGIAESDGHAMTYKVLTDDTLNGHAIRRDECAGNTKWQDSTKLEMVQLDDYDTF